MAKEAGQMENPGKLRELASWYREFAERTGNPTIWDGRLRTAEDLEAEAARIERVFLQSIPHSGAGQA
jgi:hypothetical protein